MANAKSQKPRTLRAELRPVYRACDVTLYVGRLRKRESFLWEEVDLRKAAGNGPLLLVANDEKKAA